MHDVHKGIVGTVRIGGRELTGWEMYCLPMSSVPSGFKPAAHPPCAADSFFCDPLGIRSWTCDHGALWCCVTPPLEPVESPWILEKHSSSRLEHRAPTALKQCVNIQVFAVRSRCGPERRTRLFSKGLPYVCCNPAGISTKAINRVAFYSPARQ